MASFSNFESITNRFIMKKLFFTVAITACLAINIPINVSANELSISVFQEKKYKKIKVEEVSKEVLAKIQKSYGNYSIKEAYKANDGKAAPRYVGRHRHGNITPRPRNMQA